MGEWRSSGPSAYHILCIAKMRIVCKPRRACTLAIAIFFCRWQAVYQVIPDERPLIESALKAMCDDHNCCLVVTTGGTGPAPRDVTPEATEAVSEKLAMQARIECVDAP